MDEETEGRFTLVDDRLDHYRERLEALEQARDDHAEEKESRHARAINWAMLGLFVIEVIIGTAELWMMRHG
jgi:hypothetical protein